MKIRQAALTVTATDLANHLSCRHLTALDLRLAKGEIGEPSWQNPHADVLRRRGEEHERAYLAHIRAQGREVADLTGLAPDRAQAAMRAGASAIAQAAFQSGPWVGRSDVLLRVERPSDLGPWSYEVVDCKLART